MNANEFIKYVQECQRDHWRNSDIPRYGEKMMEVIANHYSGCEKCREKFDESDASKVDTLLDIWEKSMSFFDDLEEWICEVGISDLYSHPGGAFVIVPDNAEPAFDIVLTERELDSYIANRWPGAELEEFVFSEEPEASEDERVAGVLLDGECVARVYTGTGL